MKSRFIGALIAGILFAPLGYFVAFNFGKPILDNAKASTEWPSIEGVVEQSDVTTSKNSKKKRMYSAEVVYRYTAGSRDHRGSTISFGGDVSSSSSSHASAVTNRYPVGRPVQVYYDPEDPANAVLEPGVTWKSYLVFGIGLVFLVVGVLMIAGPVCYIAIGTFVVAGAASGAIGQRKATNEIDRPAWPDDAAPTHRSAEPSNRDRADDGFDVG